MTPDNFPIERIRAAFPALSITDEGRPRVYFDNPAGTQVPQAVIDRTVEALKAKNANLGGFFVTTREATDMVDEAHAAMADFYNAASPEEIVFGQNMTSLTLHMSRCLAKGFRAGDEIVLSRMDHDANVAPWLLVAEDVGMAVKWVDFDPESCEFPEDALDKVLSDRTRLFAIGFASNCTGSINDVKAMAAKARAAGALVYVDAVQYAPHCGIDVQTLGADFLVSSAYKWFGPHQGILWGRREALERTFSYKVRPAGNELPHRFETGTLSHEGMAGSIGAIDYLARIGEDVAQDRHRASYSGMSRRGAAIHAAFDVLTEWEHVLCRRLIDGLSEFKGLKIHGVTSANAMHRRVPTVSFSLASHHPADLAKGFANENIFVWSGHNYAVEPVTRMGLMEKGGVLRVGLAHYNTPEEVDALLGTLQAML
ncbi:MAG: cysteine desulfurase-like protein [Parvibaculaceae bacterium]